MSKLSKSKLSKFKKIKFYSLNLISIFLLSTIIILFLIDSSITNTSSHTRFVWWSVWTLFFSAITSFILIIIHILAFNKSIKKFLSNKIIYIIFYLRNLTIIYLIFTFLIYNSLYFFAPKLIIDDPKSLRSLVEHVVVPIIFFVYFIININIFKMNNNYTLKKVLLFIVISLIVPLSYIIFMSIYGTFNGFFPYTQLNYNVSGWFKVLFYSFIGLIVFVVIDLIILIPLFKFKKGEKVILKI